MLGVVVYKVNEMGDVVLGKVEVIKYVIFDVVEVVVDKGVVKDVLFDVVYGVLEFVVDVVGWMLNKVGVMWDVMKDVLVDVVYGVLGVYCGC